MPGRVSGARSTRTSTAVSHKASAQSLTNTRGSTTSRVSTAYADIPVENTPETALRVQICSIFKDAQRSTASHRKLVINLRKIQEACCYETSSQKKKTGAEDFDEEDFNQEITRCVLRVMPVKKSEGVGEKVIRFLGLFLRHANEKDNELVPANEDETGMMVETPSTRLTSQIMAAVLPLMTAKEKFVRYRSTQLISHLVNSLESIDDDLFHLLRHGLLKRIRDKEPMVRVQAVLGLGRLAGNEIEGEEDSDDSDDDSGAGLLEKLLDVLQNDPSADVRRSLLVNLPILPNTLPYLLERARDQDPATRRALYSRLLPALGDFRHLSLSMREKLLRWGLRDRDENVRKAAGKLFRERWIEDCVSTAIAAEGGAVDGETPAVTAPNFEALLELLERIDVVNSGVEKGVALEAMKGFWEGRPDYRDAISFEDNFWDILTAESVFMARSFNDFCRTEGNGKLESLIEEKMPEVTKLAYYLQRYINVLIEALKRVATAEYVEGEEEEDTVEQEFIVEQLLHIAQTLDYSDEVGRRKMFALLRQSLAVPDLPEEVTKLTIEVLRDICAGDAAGEKEFCSVVLEAVADIHDTIMDEQMEEDVDESFHSARSEVSQDGDLNGGRKGKTLSEEEERDKAVREIMVNMKCLHIVQCMLQNVEGNLQQNSDLVAMLNNLVVPAVRSHEAPVRERGLLCLGLCSLLDKSLAEENLTLFMHFFSKGHAALQITALQILTDILTQHGAHLLTTNPALLKVYLKALKSGSKTAPEVQAAAVVSVAKLMLGRIITDSPNTEEGNDNSTTLTPASDLLKTLIVAYFDPATQTNPGVRQTLSYFLPVYAFSRRENQDRLRSVACDALHALFNIHDTLDEEDEDANDMVSLSTVGAHLVDWTDPRKCYVPGESLTFGATSLTDAEAAKKAVNGDVHLDFAKDILDRLASTSVTKEEKKILAPLLGKLHISPSSMESKTRDVYEVVSAAVDDKLVADATGRNALYKIHVSLGKIVNALNEREAGGHHNGGGRRRTSFAGRQSVMPEERSVLGSRTPSLMGDIDRDRDMDDVAPEDNSERGSRGTSKETSPTPGLPDVVLEDVEEEPGDADADADGDTNMLLSSSPVKRSSRRTTAAAFATTQRTVSVSAAVGGGGMGAGARSTRRTSRAVSAAASAAPTTASGGRRMSSRTASRQQQQQLGREDSLIDELLSDEDEL